MQKIRSLLTTFVGVLFASPVFASGDVNMKMPDLNIDFNIFGTTITGASMLTWGLGVVAIGIFFGLWEYVKIKRLPAHRSMLEVAGLIYETCKTYMIQQGKLLIVLELLVGTAIFYYFYALRDLELGSVVLILVWSVVGILGSYGVAWFGMRINTLANARTAFASLQGKAFPVMDIPLRSGMSIGVLLICVELAMMISILLFVDPTHAGACFIGFAIGESLGASALRICGGIFTKIADIGSDLMKIVFKIKEDDARNPGVIADCVGDNAGDSVGPTADGFETYGVTGVALITFIILAVGLTVQADGTTAPLADQTFLQAKFIIWIFVMRILMILTSLGSYWLNRIWSLARFKNADRFNFEIPLTSLVWVTSLVSILVTFAVSYLLIGTMGNDLWFNLSLIISCGTLAAAVIPEFTKVFTSAHSRHVNEVVISSKEGGASLNILSGLVAGNFSAFWKGITIAALMYVAYWASARGLGSFMIYPEIFAFGLVAFGMLGMGPVTIAVDSYGPVTDNAQSVFELSQIEAVPNIKSDVQRDFGFSPNFERGKELLEENDSAGNTFKATAKPVLIGTAVIGATTMIFSIILLLDLNLNLINPNVLLGLICGGAVIYWFTGASIQAVTTGAYRAVEFIKKNIRLDSAQKASIETSKEVVQICTQYAQAGMVNIFGVIFCMTLAFAFFDEAFFASYLISIAVFGLFQAMFMANAGGAWDNAKKVVEVDLKAKGTDLHAACVVGDTVGDPFKDTSSVSLNPIIKFTTLFGLLAVEIAHKYAAEALVLNPEGGKPLFLTVWGIGFFVVGLFFVYRSFYGMRIGGTTTTAGSQQTPHKARAVS